MRTVTARKIGVLPKIALIAGLDFTSLIEALLQDSLKTEDRS
jgi:hypothetical protein